MKKFNCKHDWEIEKGINFGRSWETPSVLACKKCGVHMTVNEVSQLGLWKYTIGTQKWLSIGAIIISIGALVVSFLK